MHLQLITYSELIKPNKTGSLGNFLLDLVKAEDDSIEVIIAI